MIIKTIPVSLRTVVIYTMKEGILFFEFTEKSMETKTRKLSEFPNGRKATVEQILAYEERKKCKRE